MHKALFTLFLLFVFYHGKAQSNYCLPLPSGGINGYFISKVELENMTDSLLPAVYNFRKDSLASLTCYLTAGNSYRIYATSGSHSVSTLAAWIDWDNDGTFSSVEKLDEDITSVDYERRSLAFIVPGNCYKGKLRLRIRSTNNSNINACTNYTYGQTVDYVITVLNPWYEYNFFPGWQVAKLDNDFIDGVRIGNLNNQGSGFTYGPVYGDYSYLTGNLDRCTAHYLHISGDFTSHNDTVSAFIDYNENGIFEDNEIIGKIGFAAGYRTDSVLVDVLSVSGIYRMRVIYFSDGTITEAEDYTVDIAGLIVTDIPSAEIGSDLYFDCDTDCFFYGCQGSAKFYDNSCGNPVSRTWTVPGAIPSSSNLKNPVFAFSNPGIYTITLIVTNSLGADTTSSFIKISGPFMVFSLGNDTSICNGDSLVLSAPPASDCYSYRWSTGDLTREIVAYNSGSYSVEVFSCNHKECPASDNLSIEFSPEIFNVTGGGSSCTGTPMSFNVGLNGSQQGIVYHLYLNGTLTGLPVGGTGSAISFGSQLTPGTYSVTATDTSLSCTTEMNGYAYISVGFRPAKVNVTGGGNYCIGEAGVEVGIDSSEMNAAYELFRDGIFTGVSVTGTGDSVSFPHQTIPGNYSVIATFIHTSCADTMTGFVRVDTLSSPPVFNVTGGGSFCGGTADASISLDSSLAGNFYSLYMNGLPTGDTIIGTGSSIMFSNLMNTGNYTIVSSDTSNCTSEMAGNAYLDIIAFPFPFTLTGGGVYCIGEPISNILLNGSQNWVRYQLYVDSNFVGNSLNGNGDTLNFGVQTVPGNYYVVGSHTITACYLPMNDTLSLIINPRPNVYYVTGGGVYCTDDSGSSVGLSNSETSIQYQLYFNGAPIGQPLAGTGSAIDFGLQADSGTYTILASGIQTGCIEIMNSSAVVSITASPTVQIVTTLPDTMCIYQSPVPLAGSPAGGIFSGSGINGNIFDPSVATAGLAVISYDYIDSISGCGAVDTGSIFVDLCIGVEEIGNLTSNLLYPNPADEILNIEWTEFYDNTIYLELINYCGVKVFEKQFKSLFGPTVIQIDLRNYPAGMYLIRFLIGKENSTSKIIIQHD